MRLSDGNYQCQALFKKSLFKDNFKPQQWAADNSIVKLGTGFQVTGAGPGKKPIIILKALPTIVCPEVSNILGDP
jgi:hypothetical protein